ncbi:MULTISPECIES: transposase [Streptomyces]|uniref:transposase n=1 Tax=Streptomyces TaxID=1883 RepID=UPI00368D2442
MTGRRLHVILDRSPPVSRRRPAHLIHALGANTVGPLTEPSPTDRGKSGSKIHLITDRNGLPLSLGISGANMHDSLRLKPLARGSRPSAPRRDPRRRRPVKLHTDKGHNYDHLRSGSVRGASATALPVRGTEPSTRAGRQRWVVERTVSWLAGCRRLHRRCERQAAHFLAFVGTAASLINYRRRTSS